MILSNKVYDILKWVAIIVMPALATLVKVVFTIWNLPYGTEITTTITAIATFIGALLMISNANYQKALDENIEE
jgi:phosphatidylserine synthase